MLKKTFVLICIMFASMSAIIAQPVVSLSNIEEISPKKVNLLKMKEKKIYVEENYYKQWVILESYKHYTKVDLWFQKWTCTDYASSRRPDLFIDNNKRLITWNAKEWLLKAKELWMNIYDYPRKWAIAVYFPNVDWVSSYGHVAYVEEVGDNNVIIISDMNYSWKNIVTKRTVSANSAAWYIY